MSIENTPTIKPWLTTAKQILELQLKEVPTLVAPFIPKQGTMSLAGSSDLGKSYLLLQLADDVINRRESFLGFKLNVTHAAAIYLSTEDDEYSLCPRLLNLSKGKTDTTVYDNIRIIFETIDLVKRLDILLTEHPADLVIVDTFSDIFTGDMNQANQVRGYLQKFKELAGKYKTLIIFNHHCGKKNDSRPPHKDNLLGSQGFESSMRTVIELRKDFNDENKRHLCIVKGNYLSTDYKTKSFVLDFSFEAGFTNTGSRVDFDSLVKVEGCDRQQQQKEDVQARVLALRAEGLTIDKIHEKVNAEGFKIGHTKVGTICKQYHPSIQLPLDNGTNGQAAA